MKNQHFVRTEMFANKMNIFSCSPKKPLTIIFQITGFTLQQICLFSILTLNALLQERNLYNFTAKLQMSE